MNMSTSSSSGNKSHFENDAELPSEFIKFLNSAWTRYHAVAECKARLVAAGFVELFERDSWADIIQPGGKYFFDRVGSSLVAWAVGAKYEAGNGLIIVGCHTDSPHLKLKPTSKKTSKGMLQMAIQTYGGGLWSTWFDRDLGLG
jgi:aspartyl aminopeptidase